MEPVFTHDVEEYRLQARQFLADLLPPDWRGSGQLADEDYTKFSQDLRKKLYAGGYLAINWPRKYGGQGLTLAHQVVLAEELTRAGLPNGTDNDVFSIQMFGNTLLAFGTEEQKQRFIPRLLRGDDVWCQGYSEPRAGSDLGNIGTKAVLEDGTWRINGQKIWTSEAQNANWIFVLVRTDTDAPKHKGLTLLACPTDQAGVEVRPIRQLNGRAGFNEVFFTDALTSEDNTIGLVNQGWKVAMGLLEFERGGAAAILAARFDEELSRLIELARRQGKIDDTAVRRKLAWCKGRVIAMRMLGYKALTRGLTGAAPGPESALTKLYWTEYHRTVTELSMELLGDDALVLTGRFPTIVDGPDAPGSTQDTATWVGAFLSGRASTIYAGTNQIQRNLLAERVLGMPREPRSDSGAWNAQGKG